MNFEVNGETYFLTLGENDREWLVFQATPNGPRMVPVYDDAADIDETTWLKKENRQRVN
jgi:hypothetical protein